jgi:hypothetical protein
MVLKRCCAVLLSVAVLACVAAGKPKVEWTTDLARMQIPDTPAAGKVGGKDFKLQRADYDKGITTITLRQGKDFQPDEALVIFLFLKKGETFEGRKYEIKPTGNTGKVPHIHLQQKPPGARIPRAQIIIGDYAMKLEFGKAKDGKVPGKIYVCLPDKAKSYVAGTFEVKIP